MAGNEIKRRPSDMQIPETQERPIADIEPQFGLPTGFLLYCTRTKMTGRL